MAMLCVCQGKNNKLFFPWHAFPLPAWRLCAKQGSVFQTLNRQIKTSYIGIAMVQRDDFQYLNIMKL
jgi:hypothetical protein